VPNSSGSWNIGSPTAFFHQLWANSGIYQSGVSVSGQDLIFRFNGVGGPFIKLNPGLGVASIAQQDHTFYINVSGDATYSSLHQSGYIRNVDFVQSGFITKSEVASSGFLTRTELQASGYTTLGEVRSDIHTSGYVRNVNLIGSGFKPESQTDHGSITGLLDNDHPQYILNSAFITSGFTTETQITASGYVKHTDMLVSGYLKHADLLSSGYVRSINGLSNTPSLVGSGNVQVWVDGTNVQIGTTATTLAQVQTDLHASGYIRNTNFVSSGFITKAEVASSGFLTRTELQTSGYTTLGEVRSDIHTSGYVRNANLVGSGFKPESQTDHGSITGLLDNDHPQYILNSAFITSGFITKAEVASSGFAERTQITSSGYLRVADQLYPVDARAVSGNITPQSSGQFSLGSESQFFKEIYANSGVFQSGVYVSGLPIIHTINGIPGANIRFIQGANMTITSNLANRTIQFDATAGGPGGSPESDQYPVDARAVSGHILMNSSGTWNFGERDIPAQGIFGNSGVFTSGVYVSGLPVPTQSQITTSGYVTQKSMLTSGYLRHQDLLTSGYVRTVNSLSNAVTLLAGSGVRSIGTQGSNIYIDTSGGSYTRYTRFDYPWNATSLQNASGLEYPIGPGEVICGEANLFFLVNTTATGMAFALNGPASPNTVLMAVSIPTTATATQHGSAAAYETKVIGTAGLVTTNVAQMKFFVINGPNAGTLAVRICSEGTTLVTLRKGSWAKFTRV
jgi:hypothetical protein